MASGSSPPPTATKRSREAPREENDFDWVACYTRLIFDHMIHFNIPGTEHMSLIDAVRVCHANRGVYSCRCYVNCTYEQHVDHVEEAMKALRIEIKKGALPTPAGARSRTKFAHRLTRLRARVCGRGANDRPLHDLRPREEFAFVVTANGLEPVRAAPDLQPHAHSARMRDLASRHCSAAGCARRRACAAAARPRTH